MFKRNETREVKIKDKVIGKDNKILVQSMTTTKTKNVIETVAQIKELATMGCDIVRVAVFDMEDAIKLKEIKQEINIPLIADIHFDYRLAIQAIESGVDKIRINPGNIGDIERTKAVVEACKEKGIPIRIGINSGSLEKEFKDQYGVTAEAMFYSLKSHIDILESLDFHDIVISMKSSNVDRAVKAYRLAAEHYDYPLHLGITESGTKFSGTIKSAVGLGILLYEGLGNTIRVSLSTDPVEEVKVAKELLSTLGLYEKPKIVSCPTCGRLQYNMFPLVEKVEKYLENIKEDITVAVMGCAVNGPGEAKSADIGIAGGRNGGLIFVKGETVKKVHEKDMYDELIKEINRFIKERKAN
jgi:(E)-4-hydroxy-3-methylbut-2-enyl-diphosphate synthase